jgi:hypothetical protein
MIEEITLVSKIANKIVKKQSILQNKMNTSKLSSLAKYIMKYHQILNKFKQELKEKINNRKEIINIMVTDIQKLMKEKILEINKEVSVNTEINSFGKQIKKLFLIGRFERVDKP